MADRDRITLIGLLFETSLGLRREFAPFVEESIGVGGQAMEICIRLARSEGGAMRMSDLAIQTGISPSGLTRAVDRLVAEGLVGRELFPDDRRGTLAVLTAAGRQRMDCALVQHRQRIDEILDDLLTPEDEARLGDVLERLRDRVNPEAAFLCGADETSCDVDVTSAGVHG